ncbi:MAG: hypothetical protein QM664_10150, partial [Flavihumibacter sp.]
PGALCACLDPVEMVQGQQFHVFPEQTRRSRLYKKPIKTADHKTTGIDTGAYKQDPGKHIERPEYLLRTDLDFHYRIILTKSSKYLLINNKYLLNYAFLNGTVAAVVE